MKGIKNLLTISILFILIGIAYANTNSANINNQLNKINIDDYDNKLSNKINKYKEIQNIKSNELTIQKSNELYVVPGITITKNSLNEDVEITILKNQEITILKNQELTITTKNSLIKNDVKNQQKESDYITNNINSNKPELNELYSILKNDSINNPSLDLTPKYQEDEFLKKLASN